MIIYRALYSIAFILARILFFVLPPKVRTYIRKRNLSSYTLRGNLIRPVWIHAASGEIEYARPLIREIKRRQPNRDILVTFSSMSALKTIEKISEISGYGLAPFDTPQSLKQFYSWFNPSLCLISRTDVWPELTLQNKLNNIPTILFSATFASNSSRLKGVAKFFTRLALKNLSHISVVSQEDAQNIAKLNLNVPITVDGDTRYDQVLFRLLNANNIKPLFSKEIDLIAGSTWTQDEDVLIPAAALLKKKKSNFKMIVVPHEIQSDHIQKIETTLAQNNFSHSRYSELDSQWNTDVLIVDTVGILADLYRYARVAFVGGSFVRQVHSVMEPLACGIPVIVGPYFENNREAVEFRRLGFVSIANSTEELAMLIERNLSQSDTKSLQHEIKERQGATLRIVELIASV